TGDFDGDGRLDLIVATPGGTAWILLGNGDGTFRPPTSLPTSGGGPVSLAVGDLHRGGKLDVGVAFSAAKRVAVLLGDGHGGFSPLPGFSPGTHPTDIAVADFDGDGKPDLAVALENGNAIWIFPGDGTGSFRPPMSVASGAYPKQIVVADVN